MSQKTCTVCKESKNTSEFYKSSRHKYGVSFRCKECDKSKSNNYHRTIDGLIARIIADQKKSSKRRIMTPPDYSNEELKSWLYSNGFQDMYFLWVGSDYDKWLSPSPDRLDDSKPYTLCNLRLITWKENDKKGRESRPNRKAIGVSKIN